jgi:hypothetical protein
VAGTTSALHSTSQSFVVTVDRRGDIYSADLAEGDPGAGATVIAQESARLGTRAARRVEPETITTRSAAACDPQVPAGPQCDEVRETSRFGETSPTDGETYSVYRSSVLNDDRLSDVVDMTEAVRFPSTRQPVAIGPLNSALAVWQRPPPAHGSQYQQYDFTETVDTSAPHDSDGLPDQAPVMEHLTFHLWVDATTKLALKLEVNGDAGWHSGPVYFNYAVGRMTTNDVPAAFFSVAKPTLLDQDKSVDFTGTQPIGQRTDEETLTTFAAYSLGLQPTIGGRQFCLDTGLRERLVEPGSDTITDPTVNVDDEFPGQTIDGPPGPLGPMTRSGFAYYEPASPGVCVPGQGPLDNPPLEVHSAASSSSTAASWRTVYRETGEQIALDPLHEDYLTSGPAAVLFGGLPTIAYVVRTGDDEFGALVEGNGTAVIVRGPFDRLGVAQVISQLVPQ